MAAIVTFDFPNRRIIEIGVGGDNDLDVNEIYSEWKIAVQSGNFLGEQPAFSVDQAGNDGQVGGIPTPTPTGKLGSTFFLGAGWKIRPAELSHRLILRGNIYSADGSRVTADTLGAFTVEVAIEFTNLIEDLDQVAVDLKNLILPLYAGI